MGAWRVLAPPSTSEGGLAPAPGGSANDGGLGVGGGVGRAVSSLALGRALSVDSSCVRFRHDLQHTRAGTSLEAGGHLVRHAHIWGGIAEARWGIEQYGRGQGIRVAYWAAGERYRQSGVW